MKAYFTRIPLQSTPRLFQDVSLFLDKAKLRSKLQDFLFRFQKLARTLFFLARPNVSYPLVQTVARDAESSSHFCDGVTSFRHLADSFILDSGLYS